MHITLLLLLMASPMDNVSEGTDVVPERSRAEWVNDVTEALRHQATADDVDQPQAVLDLISLYQRVTRDTSLRTTDRDRLMIKLRARLLRVSPKLSRDVAIRQARIELMQRRAEADQQPQAAAVERLREDQLVFDHWQQALGQVIGPGAAGGGAAGGGAAGGGVAGGGVAGGLPDHGEELVELIQTVISPESWEVHGGPMSIFYFKSRRVLVVSATSEVHEKIGGLGADLRRAGN